MIDEKETRLQLVADNAETIDPLVNMAAYYAREIDDRRRQLDEDLDYFESKLRDLEQLDPLDVTNLAKIYRGHVSHIRGLLASSDQSDD